MKYTIPCVWQNYGYISIEADNLEEAIRIAKEDSSLPQGEYVDDSFEVDHDVLLDWNADHESEIKDYLSDDGVT